MALRVDRDAFALSLVPCIQGEQHLVRRAVFHRRTAGINPALSRCGNIQDRMGLDAVVYRNRNNLPFDPDGEGAEFNSVTGEYYFADDAMEERFPYETRVAISKAIGNIARVDRLREEAQAVLDEDSVVLSKVLYSGTHTGDTLDSRMFVRLERELSSLARHAGQTGSERLKQFASDMSDLLAAARAENNPIVF